MARTRVRYDPDTDVAVTMRDVEYRRDGDRTFLARLYEPAGPGPFPLLLDVHGGGWTIGDRSSNEPISRAIAASGAVVAAVDYRLAPGHPYPAQVADVSYALCWFRSRAAEFNVDPDTAGLLGSSSGGHTAMLAAMRPSDRRYAALRLDAGLDIDPVPAYVVALWPPLDPLARYRYARATGRSLLAERTRGYFRNEAAIREGNPQLALERREPVHLPPLLIIHGAGDTEVPVFLSERFARYYLAAGGSARLEIFPAMPHLFMLRGGAESERALRSVKSFVAEHTTRPGSSDL
jgi:acetyl esterase